MKKISIAAAIALMLSHQPASSLTTKEKAELAEVAESYEDCVVGQLDSFDGHPRNMSQMIAPIMAACEAPYEGARATDRSEAEVLHHQMEALIKASDKANGVRPVYIPTDLDLARESTAVDYWSCIKDEASEASYRKSSLNDTLYMVRVKCAGNYENVRIFDEPYAEKMREAGGIVIANAKQK